MSFTTIEQLSEYLEKDAKKASINPVRFINVETIDMWVKVKSLLGKLATNHIKVSSFCEDDDTTPNLFILKSKIKKVTDTTLLTPISEYLRINNTIAKKIFEDFLHIEYENSNGKLRLYIPVYRMKEVLATLTLSPRTADCLIFLDTKRENDYSLTIVQSEIQVDIDGNRINGFRNYFRYWEENPDKPIILYTQNAIHYQDVVFSDDVRVVISSYDLLNCHYNLPSVLKENYGTEAQWNKLAIDYRKTKEINSTLATILDVSKFSIELFSKWKTGKEDTKWLIWLWAKYQIKEGYLFEVLNKTDRYTDFIDAVYTTIINFIGSNNFNSYYEERNNLIDILDYVPTSKFWEQFYRLGNKDRLKVLTNKTKKEKEEIILAIKNDGNNQDVNELRGKYDLLVNYLEPMNVDDLIDDYFNQYRWLKVQDRITPEFLELVNTYAAEKGMRIFHFDSRNSIVNKLYDEKSIILFVDAMGLEYLPLLRTFFPCEYKVGYCNMPSTTSHNNDFFKNKNNKTIYTLDEQKHSNIKFPESIINELEIVESIVKEVEVLLVDYEKVIIAADHGTSRLAVLGKGKDYLAKDSSEKYKYGRYCADAEASYDNIPGIIPNDNYWIFANYDRFSQHGAPIDEIHGGASLEEMLVPVICIYKNTNTSESVHKRKQIIITLLTPSVKVSLDKTVTVKFKLDDNLDSVVAVVNNERIKCEHEGDVYYFNHKVGQANKYTAKIVSDGLIGEIKYSVIKGISSNIDF